MKKRLLGLDVVRAISAILIVLYHYTYRYGEHEIFNQYSIVWSFQVPWGCLAIVTFFMLSGFLVYDEAVRSVRPIKYFFKRCCRLFPVLWAAIIITLLFEIMLFPSAIPTLKEIILNFTGCPQILGARYVDGAYWTLQYEFVFLIWITLSIMLNKLLKKSVADYIIVFLVIISIFIYAIQFLSPDTDIALLRLLMMPEYIGVFSLGYFTNKFFQMEKRLKMEPIIAICWLSCFIWLAFERLIFLLINWFIVIYIVYKKERSFINRKNIITTVFVKVASFSYPLYLIHQNVGYCVINVLIKNGCDSEVILIIPILVSVIIAFMLNTLIEKPILNLVRSRMNYDGRSAN